MKARLFLLLAIGLVALGVVGDRLLTSATSQPTATAVAATSKTKSGSRSHTNTFSNPTTTTRAIDQATESAYGNASPSVVYVVSEGVGSGSGIIYDSKGDVVTNYHVISGANGLKVTLKNGKTYTATVVGTDQADDLAVIHINASGLTPAHFARARSYQVAETVLAIGAPLGLKQSVTLGIISGLGRVEQEPNGAYLPDAIQTSAPINPGNSGGALVSLDGTVVGIPTLEQTSTQSGESAQNVGFAIPANRVVPLINQIISTGKVEHTGRAYLGIAPSDATGGSGFGQFGQSSPSVSGALVQQVASGGPAAKAGIQQGDIITSANGTSISDAQDLLVVLAHEKPGDTLNLKMNRNGSTISVSVKLGQLPASA